MKKIFIFNNTKGVSDWNQILALCEDGYVLAGHICSHPCFIPNDMGITSNWKHEKYNKHCGEGNWELELVKDVENHEGIKKALELNAKIGEARKLKEEDRPGVKITFGDGKEK